MADLAADPPRHARAVAAARADDPPRPALDHRRHRALHRAAAVDGPPRRRGELRPVGLDHVRPLRQRPRQALAARVEQHGRARVARHAHGAGVKVVRQPRRQRARQDDHRSAGAQVLRELLEEQVARFRRDGLCFLDQLRRLPAAEVDDRHAQPRLDGDGHEVVRHADPVEVAPEERRPVAADLADVDRLAAELVEHARRVDRLAAGVLEHLVRAVGVAGRDAVEHHRALQRRRGTKANDPRRGHAPKSTRRCRRAARDVAPPRRVRSVRTDVQE